MIHIIKLPFARPLALLALLALPLVACGGGDIDDDTDGGTTTDAGTDGGTEQPACDREGFTAATQYAFFSADDSTTPEADAAIYVFADTSETAPLDELNIDIYEAYGASLETGTYPIEDVNYVDCGLCVLAYAGCDENFDCARTFYAREGSVNVTQLDQADGGRFVATLSDAVFDEVTIDWEGTLESTPVAGGENWCIDSFAFDAGITEQ